jgi:hypothetical protein
VTPYLQTHHLGVSLGGRDGKTPAAGLGWSRPRANEEATHGPGETPQRESCLLSSFRSWASTGESHVGSAGKTMATPSDAIYLIGGVVMVSSHSDQLQGCIGYAVVAWPAAVLLQ